MSVQLHDEQTFYRVLPVSCHVMQMPVFDRPRSKLSEIAIVSLFQKTNKKEELVTN